MSNTIKLLKSEGFKISFPRKNKYYAEARTITKDQNKYTLVKFKNTTEVYYIR